MTDENGHGSTSIGTVTPELRRLKVQVDHDEDVVNAARARINDIFSSCNRLGKAGPHDIAHPILESVHSLAIKLEKLRISALRIKVNSLNASIASTKIKVDAYRGLVQDMGMQLESTQRSIADERQLLQTNFNSAYHALTIAVTHIREVKMNRIQQQISSHRRHNFRILCDFAFGKSSDVDMRLFDEPIIELRKFKDFKIQSLNRFLHNMITLQKHLSMVLNVRLPYLASLLMLLPGFIDTSEEIADDDYSDQNRFDDGDISGSIIRLGDATKLPLSSKTINYQRRESHRKLLGHDDAQHYITLKFDNEQQLGPTSSEANLNGQLPTTTVTTTPHCIMEEDVREMTLSQLLTVLSVIARIFCNFFSVMPASNQKPRISSVSFRQTLTNIRHIDVDLVANEAVALDTPMINSLTIKIYKAIIGNHPQDGMRKRWSEIDIQAELIQLMGKQDS